MEWQKVTTTPLLQGGGAGVVGLISWLPAVLPPPRPYGAPLLRRRRGVGCAVIHSLSTDSGAFCYPFAGNMCCFEGQLMLRCIVCLRANNCLRAGKRLFGYRQKFENKPYGSSMDAVWFPDGCRSAPRCILFRSRSRRPNFATEQ